MGKSGPARRRSCWIALLALLLTAPYSLTPDEALEQCKAFVCRYNGGWSCICTTPR